MIIKIFFLVVVMNYFINSGNGKNSAIIWGVAMFVSGLVFGGFKPEVFLWAAISFAIAYAVFYVLERAEGSSWYWLAFIFGIGVLVLFG